MLEVIATGIGLIALTVVMHAVGTVGLMRSFARHFAELEARFKARTALLAIVWFATALMILHVLEILLWALAYRWLVPSHRLDTFEEATYFSFVTFTTVGYGDVTLGVDEWRLLSGIEALDGILLVGWSTALLFAVLQRSWRGLGHHGN
ncbi:MAG: potassium channel family protein [Thiohalocapsa sp.]|jgi:hypothetical protein|uniref:potassium channel family protein n=1 Tax=Thiohalocapsa sp. TaxID=2497641 RepID=UPI0025F3850F|nr:potassium channel family protein [Thiohalocapsa sp.]MCG6940238.1 potassium channel family protein [Thiohalocapsa sp.]